MLPPHHRQQTHESRCTHLRYTFPFLLENRSTTTNGKDTQLSRLNVIVISGTSHTFNSVVKRSSRRLSKYDADLFSISSIYLRECVHLRFQSLLRNKVRTILQVASKSTFKYSNCQYIFRKLPLFVYLACS